MTIPMWTTTITVQRQNPDRDPEGEDWAGALTIATGVHAHLTLRQTGSIIDASSNRTMANSILMCDTTPIESGDRIINEKSGEVWEVEWFIQRDFDDGFDYTRAEVIKRTAEMGAML